jgi:tetratricopeptide (TPR) repeat protein
VSLPEKDRGGHPEIPPSEIFDLVAGDPPRYRPIAAAMAARARRAGDHATLVRALCAQAWADRSLLDGARAKETFDEAVRIARRHGLAEELTDALASRSAVHQELGRLTAAQRDLDEAGAAAPAHRRAELRFRQAILLQNIGRLAEAERLYRSVPADASLRVRLVSENNLALILSQRGRHAEALRRLDAAAKEADAVGPAVVALIAQTTAWVTVQAGRLREGLELFERAAAAYTDAGLPMAEHYIEYVDALLDLWLLPEARRAARQATDALGDVPLMGVEARLRVAQIAVLADDPAEAVRAAAEAVRGFEQQHRAAWTDRARLVAAEARLLAGDVDDEQVRTARRVAGRLAEANAAVGVHAYLIAGRLAAAIGRTRPAVELLTRAAELSRGAPALVRLRGLVAAATAARLRERDGEALRHCAQGLQHLARHRSALPSMELRARASSHGVELGRIGTDLAVRSGSAARVLSWMERTRAAALLAWEPPPDAELAGRLADDLAALRAVQAELNSGADAMSRDSGPNGGQNPALDRLVARQREIEERIRRATWRSAAPEQRRLPQAALPELRAALGRATLVEYGRAGTDLIAVVVGVRRARLVHLGPIDGVRAPGDALFFALRRLSRPRPAASLAAARASADAALTRLRQLLLDPLRLSPDGELVVVPFGPLHGLPWPALHGGPVTSAPSAAFWARTRALAAAAPPGGLVVVAGPELEGARAEAAALGQLYPAAQLLTPPESTVAAVTRALEGASTVHFACHGRLRSDNPMFSALLLSDGSLTVQELTGGLRPPHRVILAACESGSAVHYAGDEFVGFVSALMARGTAGVLASIAAIPDMPTATLMTALHRRLLAGDTLGSALHAARGTLDTRDPATFVTWCTLTAHGAA